MVAGGCGEEAYRVMAKCRSNYKSSAFTPLSFLCWQQTHAASPCPHSPRALTERCSWPVASHFFFLRWVEQLHRSRQQGHTQSAWQRGGEGQQCVNGSGTGAVAGVSTAGASPSLRLGRLGKPEQRTRQAAQAPRQHHPAGLASATTPLAKLMRGHSALPPKQATG